MATNNNVYYATALDQCGLDQKYRYSFGAIVKKDSPNGSFGFDKKILEAECIDVDRVETDNQGRNGKTMDLIVGLADFDDVKQKHTRTYLLPVELKLNCVAFNLKVAELKGKDKHTRNLIRGTFSKNSVFIFTEQVAGQAISNYNRWKRGTAKNDIKNWLILNPHQFNTYIKLDTDLPYVPQTDFNTISNTIDNFIEKNDIDGCYDYIAKKVEYVEETFGRIKYNRNEVKSFANKLNEKMNAVCRTLNKLDKEYLMDHVNQILHYTDNIA